MSVELYLLRITEEHLDGIVQVRNYNNVEKVILKRDISFIILRCSVTLITVFLKP